MRILITEKIAADAVAYLREQGFAVDETLGLSQTEIEQAVVSYDALIVRSVTQVNRSLLAHAEQLKVVGRAGNGTDNIDVPACTEKGIIVVNTPEANIMAAGELAVGLAFAIFRNICLANSAAHQDDFRRGRMIGHELEGKVAGVIGMGRIGSIVARKLRGIGMTVVAYDPYIPAERFDKLGVTRCDHLDDLLRQADLITLHTPKTKETYNMLDSDRLARCKPGVRIVNAARGGLVNEAALCDALKSGQVAGAAIDVLDQEPSYDKKPGEQQYHNALLDLPNCIITPHLGASTHEANANVGSTVTELVARALHGELVCAVNMPAVSGSLAELKPYLSLCEKLGAIYYQAETARIKKVEIIFSGELASKETSFLTLSVLKGFLSTITNERISYVNVKQNLTNMGVEVVESKTTHLEKYTNLVTVRFFSEEKTLSVSGTVFGKDTEVLVDFFGYHMDFELSPFVLAMQNNDVPGIIGRVGTLLGQQDINIATMHWSRKKDKMRAQSFLSIDSPVDEKTLDALRGITGVLRVSVLNFSTIGN
ncbi:MAG: phosphoglycerate dehydrogenase [Clostridiaceae bacterium]|jgi:D-3-phosphoglycerate dehydrogenase|nr:phosphoglycerate dehydrogenase [Clostridiaceae bacterium]